VPFSNLFASEEAPANIIIIPTGSKTTIPFDGVTPFIANEEVALIKEETPSSLTIVAIGAGHTELLYWRNGQLISIPIESLAPKRFTTNYLTPIILQGQPYFTYNLSNSFSISPDDYYFSPSFNHNLGGTYSNSGTTFNASIGYSYQDIHDRGILSNARASYKTFSYEVMLGNISGSGSQLTDALGGFSIFGASTQIRTKNTDDQKHIFHFFGGMTQPQNFFEIEITNEQQKVIGGNYIINFIDLENIAQDFASIGFYYYQTADLSFQPAGYLEGRYQVGKFNTFGAGIALDPGGFHISFEPTYEREKLSIRGLYFFQKDGFQDYASSASGFDDHSTSISLQKTFNN